MLAASPIKQRCRSQSIGLNDPSLQHHIDSSFLLVVVQQQQQREERADAAEVVGTRVALLHCRDLTQGLTILQYIMTGNSKKKKDCGKDGDSTPSSPSLTSSSTTTDSSSCDEDEEDALDKSTRRRLRHICKTFYEPVELQIESISGLLMRLMLFLFYAVFIAAIVVEVIPQAQWRITNICGPSFYTDLMDNDKWSSPCVTVEGSATISGTFDVFWAGNYLNELEDKFKRYRRIALSLPRSSTQTEKRMEYRFEAEVSAEKMGQPLFAMYPVHITCKLQKKSTRCDVARLPEDLMASYGDGKMGVRLIGVPAEIANEITGSTAAVGVAYQRRSYTIGTMVWRYFFLLVSVILTLRFIAYKKHTSQLYEQTWVMVLQGTLFWYLNPLFALNVVTEPLPAVLAFIEFRVPTYFMAITIAFMLSVMTASMKWKQRKEAKNASRIKRFFLYSKNVYDPPAWTKIIIITYVLTVFVLDVIYAAVDSDWESGANSSDEFRRVFWSVIALLLFGGLICLVMLVYLRNYLGKKPYLESRPQQLACRVFIVVFLTSTIFYIIQCLVFFLLYNKDVPAASSTQPFVQLPPIMVATFFVNIMTLIYTTRSRDENVPVSAMDERWKQMVWPDTWYRWLATHGGSQYIFCTEEEETNFYKLQFEFRKRQYMAKMKRKGRRVHYARDCENDGGTTHDMTSFIDSEYDRTHTEFPSSLEPSMQPSGADDEEDPLGATRRRPYQRQQQYKGNTLATWERALSRNGHEEDEATAQSLSHPSNVAFSARHSPAEYCTGPHAATLSLSPRQVKKYNSTPPSRCYSRAGSVGLSRQVTQTYNGGALPGVGILNMDHFSTYFLPASSGKQRRAKAHLSLNTITHPHGANFAEAPGYDVNSLTGTLRQQHSRRNSGDGGDERDLSKTNSAMFLSRSVSALTNRIGDISAAPLVTQRNPQDPRIWATLGHSDSAGNISRSKSVHTFPDTLRTSSFVFGPNATLRSAPAATAVEMNVSASLPGALRRREGEEGDNGGYPCPLRAYEQLVTSTGNIVEPEKGGLVKVREKLGKLLGKAEKTLVEKPIKKFDRWETTIFDAAVRPFQSVHYLPFFNLETAVDCYNMSWEAYGVEESAGDKLVETGIEMKPTNAPKVVSHGVKTMLCGCCAASDEEEEEEGGESESQPQQQQQQRNETASNLNPTTHVEVKTEESSSQRKHPHRNADNEAKDKVQEQPQSTEDSNVFVDDDADAKAKKMTEEEEQEANRRPASANEDKKDSPDEGGLLPINVEKYGFIRLFVAEVKEVQVLITKMDVTAPEHEGKAPRIIIAFRGTANASNAKYDVNIHRVVWREMDEAEKQDTEAQAAAAAAASSAGRSSLLRDQYLGCAQCCRSFVHNVSWRPTVHAGFLSIWKAMKPLVVPRVMKEIEEDPDTVYRVFVTGHSLGGALASLCAYSITRVLLKVDYPIPDVTVYTYGQPRLGNRTFCNIYNATVPRSFRVINESDMVVTMTMFGGYHVGIEVNIDRNGNYIVKPTEIEKLFPPTRGRGLALLNHLMSNYGISINAIGTRTACPARCLDKYVTALSESESEEGE